MKAHGELEKIVLTSNRFLKIYLEQSTAILYEGLYFDPLLKDIEAFLDTASTHVNGEVGVQFIKEILLLLPQKSRFTHEFSVGTYGEKMGRGTPRSARFLQTLRYEV